jgi:3',5'-cyclic AMP phosphodiesterase CpdA
VRVKTTVASRVCGLVRRNWQASAKQLVLFAMAPLTIAQLTDVHLGPIRGFTPRYWDPKRLSGYINWRRNRRGAYRRDVLDRLVADLRRQAPDHIAVTGDLVNIGLPDELAHALTWLESLGSPQAVSAIPGNHDIYGRLGRDIGTARWQAYMTSDGQGSKWTGSATSFPYLRVLGRVALIGVNSAIVTPPMIARGRVGPGQRDRVAQLLDRLGHEGLYRLVLIHHPPVPGLAKRGRELRDAAEFEGVLRQHGAELVIHGHNHVNSLVWVPSVAGPVPIVGAPSASLGRLHRHEPLARYNLYRIDGPPWRTELVGRGLAEPDGPIVELERRALVHA